MSMFEKLLPRHLDIIYAINQRHLDVSIHARGLHLQGPPGPSRDRGRRAASCSLASL